MQATLNTDAFVDPELGGAFDILPRNFSDVLGKGAEVD